MVRRRYDPSLERQAIRGPGVDSRAWGQMCRVVDDADGDAFEWDESLGWLCTMDSVGGPYDGDADNLGRIPSQAQGNGVGYYYPPRATGLVVATIPTGDPNDVMMVVGQLHSEDETAPALAAALINGDTIVERDAGDGQVAAAETHMAVFPDEDLDQEWRNVRITADAMVLGAPDAEQPFVRGNDLESALGDFADAISQFAQDLAGSAPAPPNAALTVADAIAASAPLISAAEALKAAFETILSTRINGD
jgi:hypothetical protein